MTDNDNDPILTRHKPASHYRITATKPDGTTIVKTARGIKGAHFHITTFARLGYQFKAEVQ